MTDVFYKLSTENICRARLLHEYVVRIINEYRKRNGEPPKEMMAIYNYVHEEEIELIKEV